MQFFELAYPATGPYIVTYMPKGKVDANGKQATWHRGFDRFDDAVTFLLSRDAMGENAYMAQARFDGTLKANGSPQRKQENAVALKSFFLDLDVNKPNGPCYTSQLEAAKDLHNFCAEIGLPQPTYLSSGYGIYAYWFLADEVVAPQWRQIAFVFKDVLKAHGVRIDPARPADSASVLRIPGARNHKYETDSNGNEVALPKKDVKLISALSAPISLGDFAAIINRAAGQKGIKSNTFAKPKADPNGINADLMDFVDKQYPAADAHQIAEKCLQMRAFRDQKGDVSEPFWYAALQVLRLTVQGMEVCQEWSSGHAEYSLEATEAKVAQLEKDDIGPTLCKTFDERNIGGCMGCLFKDKVSSPIVLGRILPEKVELTADEVEPPRFYARTVDGLFAEVGDGETVHFYNHDLFVTQLAFDESLGHTTMKIRHHLPHDGWTEFTIRAGLVHDQKQCIMALNDNGVVVGGGNREKKLMVNFLEGYQKQIQQRRKMQRLFSQMGWKDDPKAFVLGRRVFYPDGRVEEAPLAKNLPPAASAYKENGDLQKWIDMTKVFNLDGMEGLAFAFLAGAFGAPLMRFTGFEGGMLSLVGPSGVGKSLVSRVIQSTYGEPSQLMMLRDDTKNSLVSRLGVYGSLPMTIDEVTNMEPRECSDLAYRITQGRDKARLDRSGTERTSINQWNTIAIISSNHSFVSKLSVAKADASAEINRVFEYAVDHCPEFTRALATEMHRTVSDNYGLAGQLYVKYLIENADKHRANLDKIIAQLDSQTGAPGEERFWTAIAACAILGGMYAKHLGLLKFNVQLAMAWAVEQIKDMRITKSAYVTDSIALLGQYFSQHANNCLVVPKGATNPRELVQVRLAPRGALHHRIELDTQRAIISRDALKTFLFKVHGDVTKLTKDLEAIGALVEANKRKVLGAGTEFSGTVQPCLIIDLSVPALGIVALKAVELPRMTEEEVEAKLGRV